MFNSVGFQEPSQEKQLLDALKRKCEKHLRARTLESTGLITSSRLMKTNTINSSLSQYKHNPQMVAFLPNSALIQLRWYQVACELCILLIKSDLDILAWVPLVIMLQVKNDAEMKTRWYLLETRKFPVSPLRGTKYQSNKQQLIWKY